MKHSSWELHNNAMCCVSRVPRTSMCCCRDSATAALWSRRDWNPSVYAVRAYVWSCIIPAVILCHVTSQVSLSSAMSVMSELVHERIWCGTNKYIGYSAQPVRKPGHLLHYRAGWNADAVAMRICLSIRPSVSHTRGLWQNGRKICPNFYIIRKSV